MKIWIYVLKEGVAPGSEQFHERQVLCQVYKLVKQSLENGGYNLLCRAAARHLTNLSMLTTGVVLGIEYETKDSNTKLPMEYTILDWVECMPCADTGGVYLRFVTYPTS